MDIWVSKLAYPVTALGPGQRVALWVCGCSLHCPGCITPMLWDRSAGVRKDTASVARRLLAIEQPLDGITVTGGEPFEQPAALADLLARLVAGRPDWSVLVYSGQTLAALRRRGGAAIELLDRTDVLIAGAFRRDRPPRHPLAGSGNQRVHLLSARGRGLRGPIESLPAGRAELGLGRSGEAPWLIGVMDEDRRRAVKSALGVGNNRWG